MKEKCRVYLDDCSHSLRVDNSLIIQIPDRIVFFNVNDGTIISKKVLFSKYTIISTML